MSNLLGPAALRRVDRRIDAMRQTLVQSGIRAVESMQIENAPDEVAIG